jgi:hypothetical protein
VNGATSAFRTARSIALTLASEGSGYFCVVSPSVCFFWVIPRLPWPQAQPLPDLAQKGFEQPARVRRRACRRAALLPDFPSLSPPGAAPSDFDLQLRNRRE